MADLDHRKMKAKRAIDRDHQDIMLELTGDATVEERDTWSMKVDAAEQFFKHLSEDPNNDLTSLSEAIAAEEFNGTYGEIRKAKMILVEASIAEIDPVMFAHVVMQKSFAFQYISAIAAGTRTKGKRYIDATTTIEELEQVLVLIEQAKEATTEQVRNNVK